MLNIKPIKPQTMKDPLNIIEKSKNKAQTPHTNLSKILLNVSILKLCFFTASRTCANFRFSFGSVEPPSTEKRKKSRIRKSLPTEGSMHLVRFGVALMNQTVIGSLSLIRNSNFLDVNYTITYVRLL